MAEINLKVVMANELPEWAKKPEYDWFARAYGYAATQTRALPALSKCTPEEIYCLIYAMLRELDCEHVMKGESNDIK
jgi:hypothetical protein